VSTFQLAKWARLILCCCFKLAKNGNLSSISNGFPPKEKKFILENSKVHNDFYFLWGLKGSNFWGLKNKKRGLKITKLFCVFLMANFFSNNHIFFIGLVYNRERYLVRIR
jgi:hypothetical protein